MKLTLGNAFLYYLKAFNSDIATTLQTLGGDTILATYDISIKEESTLIQEGKLALRSPMPLFPDMPTHQPTMALIPTTTIIQPLFAPIASTSSNELGELKIMM